MSEKTICKFTLELPVSLKEAIGQQAKADGVTLNQWIVTAVAQKLGAVQSATDFFAERASNAKPGATARYLQNSPDVAPVESDELSDDLRRKLDAAGIR